MHEVLDYNKTKQELEKQGQKTNWFTSCTSNCTTYEAISQWAAPEEIHDYKLSVGRLTKYDKTQRFITFQDYLFVQLKKYTFNDDWTPRKIDVSMDIPDVIDLNSLRGTGAQLEKS
jgi:ubiquitin carboxyl-terminal hydrolase 5/13